MKKLFSLILVLGLLSGGVANSAIIKLTKCDANADENYSLSKKNYKWDGSYSFYDVIINTDEKKIKSAKRLSDKEWEEGRKWRESIKDKEFQEMVSRRISIQTYNLDYFDNNFATGKAPMIPNSTKYFFFIEIDLTKKLAKTWSSPIPDKYGVLTNIKPNFTLCK